MAKLVKTNFHLPYNPKLLERAKALRKNMTVAERKLWFQCLKLLEARVRPQRVIGNFIVDFYCPSRKLVIEIDGESHLGEAAETYDEERTSVLEGYGLQVVRFTNREVMYEFEGVCRRVCNLLLEQTPSAPQRQTPPAPRLDARLREPERGG